MGFANGDVAGIRVPIIDSAFGTVKPNYISQTLPNFEHGATCSRPKPRQPELPKFLKVDGSMNRDARQ